jgi:N-acetylneuraminic acid mutarotase
LLAVGGNFAGSPVRFVESIKVAGARAEGPKVVCWPIGLDTQARQGQAVGLFQSALIAAGGNRTTEPHAFAASNLVRDAVKISLGSPEAASLPALPEPRQSAEVVVAQNGRKRELYILGGIGPHGDASRTRGDAFRFDAAPSRWTKLERVIPDRRGMFRAAVHRGAIWLFGGNIWDGDMSHPGSMPNEVLRWDLAGEKAGFVSTGKLLPRPRRSFAGAVLGNKYYLVGGLGADMTIVSLVDVFDFESGQWSSIAPPKPRLFGELAELGGKLYLAGGYWATKGGHFEPARSMEVYDPATSAWSTVLDSLPVSPEDLKLRSVEGRLLLYSLDRDTSGSCHLALVAP